MYADWVEKTVDIIVVTFEAAGVATLVVGFIMAAVYACRALIQRRGGAEAFSVLRRQLGYSIVLGLEVLVAADLIETIRSPSLEDAASLAVIVAIRTVLSISIEVEIDGVLPWKKAVLTSGGSRLADAVGEENRKTPAPRTQE